MVEGHWADTREALAGDVAGRAKQSGERGRVWADTNLPKHSSAIVVVDAAGNIALGMHTLNAFPFGEGLFVDGVPLSPALEWEEVPPGQSVLDPVSPILALRDGVPVLALAQFGAGEFPADFQVLSAVLEGKRSIVDAATGPRIAFFAQAQGTEPAMVIDPRYGRDALCAVANLGVPVDARSSAVLANLGFVDAVSIAPGRLTGIPAAVGDGAALGY
jgi:gamma-glutamyltranspeptidase